MTTVKGAIESQFGGRSGSAMGSDALRDFCQQLAHLAMVRLVFDLESGTPLFERYDEARLIFARVAPERAPTEENRTVFEQLRAVVIEQTECIRQRTRTGCSSSSALEEILRLDPDQPDATTIDNLIFVTRVGSGNVGSYLAWQLVMLGRHPEWSARLRDELTSGVAPETPNLTRRIIMETLRLEQSEYLYRKITNDFTAEGYLFPKEWLVRLCVRESHRWGDVFENPDVFDPDRFARRKFRSSEYSPFGFDHHACLGVAAIHLIGAAVIENLVRDLDWTVVVDGPPTREFRHWKHWRPGRATMLEFRPVANGPTPLPRSSEAGDS
jgi:cytochrome P450